MESGRLHKPTTSKLKGYRQQILASVLLSLLVGGSLPSAKGQPAVDTDSKNVESATTLSTDKETDSSDKAQATQENNSIQVFLPPVIEAKKHVWGSIYGTDESILSGQVIKVNDSKCQGDDFGAFSFVCPEADSLNISVLDNRGNKLWETKYTKTPRGLFVSDKSAADLIDKLDEQAFRPGDGPIISYAPSVVEPEQTFVIVGKNFSGKQGDNEVELDGKNSELLAASSRSLVAVSNRFLSLGPLKELKVSSKMLSSLPTEVDLARVNLKIEPGRAPKELLNIKVLGSTLPAAVAIVNQTLKSNLRFGGWRLGRQNIFLSPGGVQNDFALDADPDLATTELSAHIVSNGLFDPYSLKTCRNLLSKAVYDAGERAEAIRLKKREIALQEQLASLEKEHQSALESNKVGVAEESKFEDSSKAISVRLYRVGKILQARHIVIDSDGDGEYAKLADAAGNGSVGSLESVISTKDLGFTEARLFKVSGRKAEEQAQSVTSAMYLPNYKAPPNTMLQSYRKKYGRKGVIPPPPQTAILMPPPPPYSPAPDDLGPFIVDPPKQITSAARSKNSSKSAGEKDKGEQTKSLRSRKRNRAHTTSGAKVGSKGTTSL